MLRTPIVTAAIAGLLLTGVPVNAQSVENNGQPDNGSQRDAPPPPDLDQYCRQQAADQTGYGASTASVSANQRAYNSAYNSCMQEAVNAPPPPPPGYYGAPYPYYGYPYPYPYPYPYSYYGYGPYYGGPALGFSFGFGDWRGRR